MQDKCDPRIKQTFRQTEDGRYFRRRRGRDYKLTEAQAAVLIRHGDRCLAATGLWGLLCVLAAAVYATVTGSNAGQALAGPAADVALVAVVLATAVLGIYAARQVRKSNAFLRGCDSVELPPARGLIGRWRRWAAYLNTHPNIGKLPTWILIGNCGLATAMGVLSFMNMVTPPTGAAVIGPLADRVVDGIGLALFLALFASGANLLLARIYARYWAK